MRERPILFSGEMVRAILDGRKTQTRRVIDNLLCFGKLTEFAKSDTPGWDFTFRDKKMRWHDLSERQLLQVCRFGTVGDRLWVRETFVVCADSNIFYKADVNPDPWDGVKWKPSIFMPRKASRITLEITGVRVERLNDISEADAKAEGIATSSNGVYYMDYTHGIANACKPEFSFMTLWKSINGPESWAANPWVWVLEFKKV